ncbi:MAG TPA: hypothetical protein VFC63_14945 [Blastocatellia bacterium]|nr:hypothetical protein [Blastocatellia bacterium]
MSDNKPTVELVYSIFCEDVRLEVGNKLSVMGIFQNIYVQQLPITLMKLAVLSHWRGRGQHLSEVRILGPDKMSTIAVSPPTAFQIPPDGHADNVTFFANLQFAVPGEYYVQTLIDSTLFCEQVIPVGVLAEAPQPQSNDRIN